MCMGLGDIWAYKGSARIKKDKTKNTQAQNNRIRSAQIKPSDLAQRGQSSSSYATLSKNE